MNLNPSCLDAPFSLKSANAKKQWGSQEAGRVAGWPGPGSGYPWRLTSSHAWLIAGFLTTGDGVSWIQWTFLNRCSGIHGQCIHIAARSNCLDCPTIKSFWPLLTFWMNCLWKYFLKTVKIQFSIWTAAVFTGILHKLNQLLQPGQCLDCWHGRGFKISRDFPPTISRTFKAIDERVYPTPGKNLNSRHQLTNLL